MIPGPHKAAEVSKIGNCRNLQEKRVVVHGRANPLTDRQESSSLLLKSSNTHRYIVNKCVHSLYPHLGKFPIFACSVAESLHVGKIPPHICWIKFNAISWFSSIFVTNSYLYIIHNQPTVNPQSSHRQCRSLNHPDDMALWVWVKIGP